MPSLDELRAEKVGDKHKLLEVNLIYDQFQYKLETFYFWLVDFIRDGLKLKVEKISDQFGGSPGSYFFGEMGQRLAALLSQGRGLGELINTLARTIISILNEYKLIESKLKLCDDLKSDDVQKALAAYKALKSLWIDNVDIQKGGASIRSLTMGDYMFHTLQDVFMLYELKDHLKSLLDSGIIGKALFEELQNKDISELERQNYINQRVISIAKSRLAEFYNWLGPYERELRARRDILRAYLIHEVNAFVTYTEFAKPYFRYARKLLMKDYNTPDVVTVFETAIIELTLLASGSETSIEYWDDSTNSTKTKTYVPVHEISIRFRAMPTSVTSSGRTTMYSFLGRTDFFFRTYLLTKEEYEDLIATEEAQDLLFIQGMTDEFLKAVAEAVCTTLVWDKVQSDENLRKKLEELLGYSPMRPEDVKWNKKIMDELKSVKPDLFRGVEWIRKYLPDANQKKEEKKEEEAPKEESSKTFIFKVFPFTELIYKAIEKILLFVLAFPKKAEEFSIEYKKKNVMSKYEEALSTLKKDTLDTGWKIYEVFKKTFGLLAW